jgi:hypothetical protein
MKIKELLQESITFSPVKLKKSDHGEYWTSEEFEKQQATTCFVCDGTGKETYGDQSYECGYCKGAGEVNEIVSTAPELNVSNSNGIAIQEMLGLDADYSGVIPYEELPNLIRKLIKLKNQSVSQYTQEPNKSQGSMGSWEDEQGQTHIGRKGPTMYDFGRSQQQVESYIERLIKLIQFAQKHNASIGWG